MFSEIRNELLSILYLVNSKEENDKKRNLNNLLESFENDIKVKIKDLNYEIKKLEWDLETLEYVKENIGKEEI